MNDNDSGRDKIHLQSLTRRNVLRIVAGTLTTTGIVTSASGESTNTVDNTQQFGPELIEEDEDAGFNFPYFLYAPENGRDKPVLVECVNSGQPSDEMGDHTEAAERTIQRGHSRMISDQLDVPFLVPVIKDPQSGDAGHTRTQSLDTETMHFEDGRYARIDKQVVHMVDDARERLGEYGYDLPEQFMLNGFSQSGNFANNLALLQPERIASVTAGGLNGMAILPTAEAAGEEIEFQIGTGDYETLTGKEFDTETWREIPQLGYIGAIERGPGDDTIPWPGVWTDRDQARRAVDVYGFDMQRERMVYSDAIHQQAGAKTRFEVYDNAGHDRSIPAIVRDTLGFTARNIDVPYSTVVRGLVAEANEIELEVFVPAGNSDTQEVRAFVNNTDASEEPVEIRRGVFNRITLSLPSPLEVDDTVEIAVFNPGDTDLNDALYTDPRQVGFGASFHTTPEPGDTSIEVEYEVGSSRVELNLLTDNGALYWQRRIRLGRFGSNESGTETIEFSPLKEGLPFESGDELELQATLPGQPSQLRSVVDTVTIGDTDTYDPETQCLEDVSHDDVSVAINSPPTVNADTVEIECSVDSGFDEPVQPQLHPDTGAGRGGISTDWDFEEGWKRFDTVSPGSSVEGAYDVPVGTFAPADTPALGASVELRAYPESEWGLDNYVASDCAPISGVRFTKQPMAESDTVAIRYLYPDTFEEAGQIRFQVNGNETDIFDGISPGTMDTHTFSTDTIQEIEQGDEITLSLGPEAGDSFDTAQQPVLSADGGAVSFVTAPAALDQNVTLDYHLATDFDTERFAALRLYTDQTSAWGVLLDRVEPGSDTVETIDINPDEVCVPFQPGTEVTVKLVNWDDPYGTVPVETVSAVVGTERDDPEQAYLTLQMVAIGDVAPEDAFPVAVTIEETIGLVAEDVTATLVINSPTGETIYDETVGIGDFDVETTATFGEDDGTPEVGPFEVEGEYEATVQVDAANADTVDTTESFTVTTEPDEEPADDADDTDEDSPGFGVVGAVTGLAGAGYLLKRRLADDPNPE